MRLGVMVTTDLHGEEVCGIVRAAAGRGHAVSIFATDAGVRLLADRRFVALAAVPSVAVAYCEHSAVRFGVATESLPEAVVRGSQFDNAVMCTGSDKVIVL